MRECDWEREGNKMGKWDSTNTDVADARKEYNTREERDRERELVSE